MLEKLTRFVSDKEFRLTVYDNTIHVLNYERIITLEDDIISFTTKDKKIIITGNNFALLKLLDQEMLISGIIIKIEVYYE